MIFLLISFKFIITKYTGIKKVKLSYLKKILFDKSNNIIIKNYNNAYFMSVEKMPD